MVSLYQEARAALRESDFRPRKRLGQNFLVHEGVLESILRLVALSPESEVLEIGPGLGFLTRRLVEKARKVWAVEVDPFLVKWLRESPLGSHPSFDLVHSDILKAPLEEILPARKVKLVANLPYRISTPVLFRLLELRERFSFLVLMVQREVAERMAGSPGTKSYGSLSVWCQVHGQITTKVPVSPEAFFPRPKVRSMVLRLDLYPHPRIAPEDFSVLRGLVRAAFGQRRKTLRNALASWLKVKGDEMELFLRFHGIDPRRRGETLSLDEFIRLTGAVKDLRVEG